MIQRQARIVGDKINFDALAARHVDRVFANPRSRLSAEPRDFKGVAVKMNRMIVAAAVFHYDSVALPFLHQQRIDIRPGLAVDRPAIKTAVTAGDFFKDKIKAIVGSLSS